ANAPRAIVGRAAAATAVVSVQMANAKADLKRAKVKSASRVANAAKAAKPVSPVKHANRVSLASRAVNVRRAKRASRVANVNRARIATPVAEKAFRTARSRPSSAAAAASN